MPGKIEDMYKKREAGTPSSPEGRGDSFDTLIKRIVSKITDEAGKTTDSKKLEDLTAQFNALSEIENSVGNPGDKLFLIIEARRGGLMTSEEFEALKKSLETAGEAHTETPERPAKTPEELHEEAMKELAYRLEKPPGETLEQYEPSEKMLKATERLSEAKEKLLSAYQDRKDWRGKIGVLKREIKDARKSGDIALLASKEHDLEWAQNKLLIAEGSIKKLEDAYNKAKDLLKRQLIDEFDRKKGGLIRKNKDLYIARHKKEFNLRHGRAADAPLSEENKKQLIKELIDEEVLGHGKKVVLHTIIDWDNQYMDEKIARGLDERDKGRLEKITEFLAKQPRWVRYLGAGLVGAGAVAAGSYLGVMSAPVLGFAYAGKRLAGFVGGMFGGKVGVGTVGAVYRSKGRKALETTESQLAKELEEEVKGVPGVSAPSPEWRKNREKKLALARLIDKHADHYQKEAAIRRNKERNWKLAWGFFGALVGGSAAGFAFDQFGGGKGVAAVEDWLKGRESGRGLTDMAPTETKESFEGAYVGKGTPPSGIAVAPPEAVPGIKGPSGLADAPGSMDAYPDKSYVGGYGDQPLGPDAVPGRAGVLDTMRAVKGDTVWEMSRADFKARYPGFGDLTPQQQDDVLHRFIFDKHNVHDFGLDDFRKMPIGHELDFKKLTEGVDMNELMERARGLKGSSAGGSVASGLGDAPGGIKTYPDIYQGGYVDQPVGGVESTGARVGTPEPNTAEQQSTASPTDTDSEGSAPGGEPPARTGGGRTLTDEVGETTPGGERPPVTVETSFGSKLEEAVAQTGAGFSAEEYKLLRGVTVDQLLKQIPEGGIEQADMWRKFSAGESWPDLPHTKSIIPGISDYKSSELLKQVSLADAVYKLEPNQAARNLTVEQFINQFGYRLDIKKSLLSRFGI